MYVTMQNSVKIRHIIVEILHCFHLQDGFSKFEFFCSRRLHHHTKFYQNLSNGCRIIVYLMVVTARSYAKHGICRRRVSICLSVTLWYCIKMANVGSRK